MVDDFHAAEIYSVFSRSVANHVFIAEQRDTSDSLARTLRGRYDRARVVAFGKYDVLRSGCRALANSFENVHCVICIMGGMSDVKLRSRMQNLLMFIPNLLVLCGRLMVDPRVPAKERLLVAGAIVYAIVPLDFIPDVIPFVGQIDDAYLVSMSLLRLMTVTDPHVVRQYWRGGGDVIELVGSVALVASKLLPNKIKRVLTAQIEKPAEPPEVQAASVQSITPSTDFDRA